MYKPKNLHISDKEYRQACAALGELDTGEEMVMKTELTAKQVLDQLWALNSIMKHNFGLDQYFSILFSCKLKTYMCRGIQKSLWNDVIILICNSKADSKFEVTYTYNTIEDALAVAEKMTNTMVADRNSKVANLTSNFNENMT